jgi:hypothetical protein
LPSTNHQITRIPLRSTYPTKILTYQCPTTGNPDKYNLEYTARQKNEMAAMARAAGAIATGASTTLGVFTASAPTTVWGAALVAATTIGMALAVGGAAVAAVYYLANQDSELGVIEAINKSLDATESLQDIMALPDEWVEAVFGSESSTVKEILEISKGLSDKSLASKIEGLLRAAELAANIAEKALNASQKEIAEKIEEKIRHESRQLWDNHINESIKDRNNDLPASHDHKSTLTA